MADLQVIKALFTIGKYFALTPSSPTDARSSRFEKIYRYAVFTMYTFFKFFTGYIRIPVYATLPKIQLFFIFVIEITIWIHSYYTTMVVTNERWYQLIANLSRIETQPSRDSHFLAVRVPLLAFGVVKLTQMYYWNEVFGFVSLGVYFVEVVQIYSQFFYITLTCNVLRMVLARYQYQNLLRRTQTIPTRCIHNLDELKRLSRTVEDMFGWSNLLNICYTVQRIMVYCHYLIMSYKVLSVSKIRNFYLVQNVELVLFLVNICEVTYFLFRTLTWFQMGILWMILSCNAVDLEYEKILRSFNKNKALYHMVLQMRPRFTAARFFTIKKSTIFSILNTIVTFTLVIIQIDL
jgi:gustatory receptor